MRLRTLIIFFFLAVMALTVTFSNAQQVPQLINYQGRLTNDSGVPLDGVTVDLTFSFYGVESGGTAYMSVLQENVQVNKGIYNVLIGSGTITPGIDNKLAEVFQKHDPLWMGIKVNMDNEMTPRSRISSVPYALKVDAGWLTAFYNKSDYDGDGYAKVVDGSPSTTDCNDADASVNPGTPEVCDDTIDNDCDGKIDGADNNTPEYCLDTIDNDCDGLIDASDPDCLGGSTTGPMVLIPAGCYDMGDSNYSCGYAHECPVHNVCITSDFSMDIHEVTNEEYAICVNAGYCTPPSDTSSFLRSSYYGNPIYDDFPVIYVSWEQAVAYCSWAGKRLPTEAEWEYAARGGLAGKRYPWGDTISGSDANYLYSGDPWDDDTSQVEYFPANGYGLYDMAGNVFEWVNDWYSSTYYQYCVDNTIVNDPPGPASGTQRVSRGGCWAGDTVDLRVAIRFNLSPSTQDFYLGFRCAKD